LKKNDLYTIPFKGLKNGIHEFQFTIDKTFFSDFDKSEVKEGNVDVRVSVEKNIQILVFTFSLKGNVKMNCDLCLEQFDMPIDFSSKLYVRFGLEIEDSRYIGEDIKIISEDDYEIDVSQYIYEFVHLSLPVKRVHPTDENGKSKCNNDMLKIIKKMSQRESSDNNIDPRWDKLKKLTIEN